MGLPLAAALAAVKVGGGNVGQEKKKKRPWSPGAQEDEAAQAVAPKKSQLAQPKKDKLDKERREYNEAHQPRRVRRKQTLRVGAGHVLRLAPPPLRRLRALLFRRLRLFGLSDGRGWSHTVSLAPEASVLAVRR